MDETLNPAAEPAKISSPPMPAQPEAQAEVPAAPVIPPVSVVDVQFRPGGKIYWFFPGTTQYKTGDHVILDTTRGPEFGICMSDNHLIPAVEIVSPLRQILRRATEADEQTVAACREKEKRAMEVCQQKIQEHNLDMQLVSAECAFDGSKLLFFFTADGRVDFRELVKNLASIFRTRIELRQIGVRDKAKMVGGLGICGRPFCCCEFLDDFQPVSIKMAKTQNLSLNPTKISGTCGRLMCCLKYEQEAYEDLLAHSPKVESFVDTPDGRGTVIDVNLLRASVKVRMERSPDTITSYPISEIEVFRNGKARKTDPPIPEDWAPISSRPRPAPEPETPFFEPKLRTPRPQTRSAEPAVPAVPDAPRPEPKQEPKPEQKQGSRRNRNRRSGGGNADAPKQEQPAHRRIANNGEYRINGERRPRPETPVIPGEHTSAPKQEQPRDTAKAGGNRSGNRNRRRRRGSGSGSSKKNPGTPPAPEA